MAESSENNNQSTSDIGDEFDDMLNEASASSNDETEAMVDDEDAIDKLLMDNALEDTDSEADDEFAEIDKLFDGDDTESADTPIKDTDIVDEFADDEFSDDSDVPGDETPETQDDNNDQDDIIADFDITPDDEILDEDADNAAPAAEIEKSAESSANESDSKAPAEQGGDAGEQQNIALAAITSQLGLLQNAQDSFRQQLDEVSQKNDSTELKQQIDTLESAQKSLKQKISKLESKKPTLVYAALGVAIVALLVGGGLGMMGMSANSKVDELTETVVSIEEHVDFLMQQNLAKKLESVTKRVDKSGSDIAYMKSQLSEIKETLKKRADAKELETLKSQLTEIQTQNLQMGELAEDLEQRLARLQSSKKRSAQKRRKQVKKIQHWEVSLIAYRQEWYARRKAVEFSKQGVPVQVVKIRNNGETWYRLKVDGFKTKSEALAYADKVKKTLNLPSVWVKKQ